MSEFYRIRYGEPDSSPGYYQQMYRVSMLINDYDRALKYLEKTVDQTVRISHDNNASALADSRAGFDYELQRARISELKYQNELEKARSARRNTIIFAICLVLLAFTVFLLFIQRQHNELNLSYRSLVKRFVEIDKMQEKLSQCNGKSEETRSNTVIKDEEEILAGLRILLNKEKIYKEKDLSLVILSEMLNTNTSYLSHIINNRLGMNFKSLVNTKRIDEARKLLVADEYSNFSIEGIANEVGFHSRSSFYQTFKQITGLTPTTYIQNYRKIRLKEKEEQFEKE